MGDRRARRCGSARPRAPPGGHASTAMDERGLRRLLDAGRSLISELDPDAVLLRLLEVARDVTEAQYAAIGVLDERREALERFLTSGIDEDAQHRIGDLPR